MLRKVWAYQVCFQGAPITVPLPITAAREALQKWEILNPGRKYHMRPCVTHM
jgi:hypothetical protein